MLQSNHTP